LPHSSPAAKVHRLFCRCFFMLFSLLSLAALIGSFFLKDITLPSMLLGLPTILCTAGLIFLFASLLSRGGNAVKWLLAPLILLLLGLIPRLILLSSIGQKYTQVSDFATALSAARALPQIGSYFRVFSTWILYLYYLSLMPTAFAAMCSNMLLASVTGVLLYYLALQSGFGCKPAIGAALIFLWQPSFVLYTPALSPEFPHLLLALLALNCFMAAGKCKPLPAFMLYTLSGALLCLAGFFRNITVIYLIACAIVLIMRKDKKRLLGLLLSAAIYAAMTPLVYTAIETASGQTVDRNPTAHYLYVGLTQGHWIEETSLYHKIAEANQFDYEKTSHELIEKLLEERRAGKWPSLAVLLPTKLATCWAAEDYLFITTDGLSAEAAENFPTSYLAACIHLYYLAILIAISFSALKKHEMNLVFFAQIAMVGFTLLMLLSEVQSRYKIVLYPLMAICAAHGVTAVFRRRDTI
jgi:hypothetical protein